MRLGALSLVILLALTAMARADDVDWSEYVDHSPPPTAKASTTAEPAPAKPRVKRVARPTRAKATKHRVKARAKAKTRRH